MDPVYPLYFRTDHAEGGAYWQPSSMGYYRPTPTTTHLSGMGNPTFPPAEQIQDNNHPEACPISLYKQKFLVYASVQWSWIIHQDVTDYQ